MNRLNTFFMSSLLLLLSPSSWASVVVNGDFELGSFVGNNDNTMSLLAGSTTMTGWTVTGDSLAWINTPNPFVLTASSGTKFLDLTDYAFGGPYGGVRQTISTVSNAVYRISFDVGAVSGTAKVQVTAGNLSDIASSVASNGHTWTTYSSFFTASSGSTVIEFFGNQADGGGHYLGLDNVRIELFQNPNAVPEPAGCFLLILAAMPLRRSVRNAFSRNT
jgi:hypothetical protein